MTQCVILKHIMKAEHPVADDNALEDLRDTEDII